MLCDRPIRSSRLSAFRWLAVFIASSALDAHERETLPQLADEVPPRDFDELWAGFDPRAEPLEVETLNEWQEDGVQLRVVLFRIGIFKDRAARLAAVYGFPRSTAGRGEKVPGLVQIHGGGQYADYRACLLNAKRGYATVSIAWAGRIYAPDYRVTPSEVKLFWDGATDDPAYRPTTDWGALDGYHAPSRNPGNAFPSVRSAAWTFDAVESPRNSGWFLCALAARRALTFLERQPEVDAERLGVYGHSMGGKLTVMVASDARVRAAAPSCGGISDRFNSSALYRTTLGDDVQLKRVSCPILFLSPSNDFHGRIGDLPRALREISSSDWRITSSPHHNHQDTPQYEVATLLWFDEHLKGSFSFPETPRVTVTLGAATDVPTVAVRPDRSRRILAVDVFYTQHGKDREGPEDREATMHRFWRYAHPVEGDGVWTAGLRLASIDRPVWVYANVLYALDAPVTGAGYYYAEFTSARLNLSSPLETVSVAELRAAAVRATLEPSTRIEDFAGNWAKEWFTYRPDEWAITTHKLHDDVWKAPAGAALALRVRAAEANRFVIVIDGHAAEVELAGGGEWEDVVVSPSEFRDHAGESLRGWSGIRRLTLAPRERLRPKRGGAGEPRIVGGNWRGPAPEFRALRWR